MKAAFAASLLSFLAPLWLLMAVAAKASDLAPGLEPFRGAGNAAIAGLVSVPPRGPRDRLPGVIIAHDATGPDWRVEAYVEHLNKAGVLVLEIELESIAVASGRGASPAERAEALAEAAAELANDRRVDAARLGVLGFGAGGHAALLTLSRPDVPDPFAARAVLYPGCAAASSELHRSGLAIKATMSQVLLVHGDADPANPTEDCSRMATLLDAWTPVHHIVLRGAGYAWDREPYPGEGPTLLPHPGGRGRVLAAPWPYLAARTARDVAGWLAFSLGAKQEAAAVGE